MPKAPADLGGRLRRAREALGLSQGEVARRAGLKQPQVSMVESGARKNPTAALLLSIARVLDLDLAELLREPEEAEGGQ